MTLHQTAAPADRLGSALTVAALDGVSVTFHRGHTIVNALTGVSCSVLAQERIVITGASGSGKSTLLHVMAGLQPATSGRISWPALGSSPKGRPAAAGIVFQSPSLLAPLNVVENVELPLLLAGRDPQAARQRAVEALTELQLGSFSRHLPEELSGGQAQRVAVARVMATRPQLVLADEPTGQLDHATADQVLSLLIATCDVIGAALVLSTHDERVARLFHHRWTISDGQLNGGDPR